MTQIFYITISHHESWMQIIKYLKDVLYLFLQILILSLTRSCVLQTFFPKKYMGTIVFVFTTLVLLQYRCIWEGHTQYILLILEHMKFTCQLMLGEQKGKQQISIDNTWFALRKVYAICGGGIDSSDNFLSFPGKNRLRVRSPFFIAEHNSGTSAIHYP